MRITHFSAPVSRGVTFTLALLLLTLLCTPGRAQTDIRLVRDINTGEESSATGKRGVALNGRFYFTAFTPETGEELWVSDGTAAGTALLIDLLPGPSGSEPEALTVVGPHLYFAASTPQLGNELYRTDGTAAGTELVADILEGPFSGLIGNPTRNFGVQGDSVLLFAARNALPNTELWRSNGTPAGTFQLKDIELQSNNTRGSLPADFQNGDNVTYFTAESGLDNRQVWRTDGTTDGTVKVSQFIGADGVGLAGFAVFDDVAYVGARSRLETYDLYRIGPADEAPTKLIDFRSDGMLLDSEERLADRFARRDGLIYFTADAADGPDLYVTDGTEAGTRQLFNAPEVAGGAYAIRNLTAAGSYVYFQDATPGFGVELWRTDGTEAGTIRLTDLAAGEENGLDDVAEFHAFRDQLVFAGGDAGAMNGDRGRELYQSKGTAATTRLLRDIAPGVASAEPSRFVTVGDRFFFYAFTPETGRELFVAEGREPLAVTVIATTSVSCFGGADGTATINVQGGLSEEEGTDGLRTLTGLTAGEKATIIGDGGGNSVRVLFTITEPTDLITTITATPQRATTGGTVSTSAGGGTPPYRYTWADSGTPDSSRVNLAFGTYEVTVTDANGCMDTLSAVVENLVSTHSLARVGAVSVYPNPVAKTLYIESAASPLSSIHVRDYLGRVVLHRAGLSTAGLALDAGAWGRSAGLYLLYIHLEDGSRLVRKVFRKG